MHLLAAVPGQIEDGSEALDLGQDPGDMLFLTAADTELAAMSQAWADLNGHVEGALPEMKLPLLRMANLSLLKHNMSVDLYVETLVAKAKLVVVRMLGGQAYWPYGIEQIAKTCQEQDIGLILLPGDDKPDADLLHLSHLSTLNERSTGEDKPRQADYDFLWQFFIQGGATNMRGALTLMASLAGLGQGGFETLYTSAKQRNFSLARAPEPLLKFGTYWPEQGAVHQGAVTAKWLADQPVVALIFYRAHLITANMAPLDALIEALQARGLAPLPFYVSSLKDQEVSAALANTMREHKVGLTLNTTSFAIGRFATAGQSATTQSNPDVYEPTTVLDTTQGPVLQVMMSSGTREAWQANPQGLIARDLAMNIALPEVDGRVATRTISFKSAAQYDALSQCQIVVAKPEPDRLAYVADLARNWLDLARTDFADKRIGFVLANYPTKRARIGNGVGLDTPESLMQALACLREHGLPMDQVPRQAADLMALLLAGPTNDHVSAVEGGERLSLKAYKAWFSALPLEVQEAIEGRWGPAEDDAGLRDGHFVLAIHRFQSIAIGIQPARGYGLDPASSYHDPDLVPPHAYLAFYAWLRMDFKAQALVHFGKHGNLEWLPGKAMALSQTCFPDAILGPTPNFYPFIVNDPGEGSQAKRRTQAVVLDHLTPALTRAETYGDLARLERLIDEYFEASTLDPRRLKPLRQDIFAQLRDLGLDKDLGIDASAEQEADLAKLDAHLCDLKELQIRDGLHIFGQAPQGQQERDLLLALARLPQGNRPSFLTVLAQDLDLGFDPLDCDLAATYQGPKPKMLAGLSSALWRTYGDTLERLELLAQSLLDHGWTKSLSAPCTASQACFDWIKQDLKSLVQASGRAELQSLVQGLEGKFVAPGPSGAPTRGRLDVLPTGRNFYSVDSRALPTVAAWRLGWQAANLLLDVHMQEQGDYLRHLAISMWGTANMRTGGDDIAQVLALLGVQPQWDATSGRVTGFEVMPLSLLGRPRVDVTVRVSGFFRDAFPAQIDLMDSAVRAVAKLDEPADQNPLAARFVEDREAFAEQADMSTQQAEILAGHRIFGSKPQAYGAGLQALIDEGGWDQREELGQAYLAWSAFAYGHGAQGYEVQGYEAQGEAANEGDAIQTLGQGQVAHFKRLLSRTEAIVHNQDNREHDILDSDDYYQFIGGLSSAIWTQQGQDVPIYHGDNSRPEMPKVRNLELELARVMRARVTNPKWIRGVMRHGYKGAFEMTATLDYLFGFAASTNAVASHHFDAIYQAFIMDETVRNFLEEANPDALEDMIKRLIEAMERGFWQAKRNSTASHLADWQSGLSSGA